MNIWRRIVQGITKLLNKTRRNPNAVKALSRVYFFMQSVFLGAITYFMVRGAILIGIGIIRLLQ